MEMMVLACSRLFLVDLQLPTVSLAFGRMTMTDTTVCCLFVTQRDRSISYDLRILLQCSRRRHREPILGRLGRRTARSDSGRSESPLEHGKVDMAALVAQVSVLQPATFASG